MKGILRLDHLLRCDAAGIGCHNPLVGVVDLSTLAPICEGLRCSEFYGLLLREETVACRAPGAACSSPWQPEGWALLFHPDLLRGTALGRNIRNYSLFTCEALCLSEQERGTVVECLRNIRRELESAADRHSQTLIVNNIEMLLNYCVRCYDRQFAALGRNVN